MPKAIIERTRFGKEIVAEFARPKGASKKIALVISGEPSVPKRADALTFLSQKGYWAFAPRYRGTWESGGRFLRDSPAKDVDIGLSFLYKKLRVVASRETFKLNPKIIHLFGGSFGGPAVLLSANDKRVSKTVAISPVVDWTAPSKDEPLDWLEKYIREGFGEAYRFSHRDWVKLSSGRFYNPATANLVYSPSKVFIVHAKDDRSVDWKPVSEFAQESGATLKLLSKGGHGGVSWFSKPHIWKSIHKFLLI